MPRRLRARRSTLLLALVAALQAWVAAPLHDLAPDDPACQPFAVVHDASRHVVRADSGDARDDGSGHCVTCHWIRGLFSVASSGDRVEAARPPAGGPPLVLVASIPAPAGASPSPRAPPA